MAHEQGQADSLRNADSQSIRAGLGADIVSARPAPGSKDLFNGLPVEPTQTADEAAIAGSNGDSSQDVGEQGNAGSETGLTVKKQTDSSKRWIDFLIVFQTDTHPDILFLSCHQQTECLARGTGRTDLSDCYSVRQPARSPSNHGYPSRASARAHAYWCG